MSGWITINVAPGAIVVNYNNEPVLADIQQKLANVSQRLDDIVVNMPAQAADMTQRLNAGEADLEAAQAEQSSVPPPTQP